MIKNLKPGKLFIPCIILLSWIVYHFSISKTIELYSKSHAIEVELKHAIIVSSQLNDLKVELKNLENSIGTQKHANNDIQQRMLEIINVNAPKDIVLTEFPPISIFNDSIITIETIRLVFKGEFIPLLRAVELFEKTPDVGKVVSTRFKRLDQAGKKPVLTVTMYIQNFKQI